VQAFRDKVCVWGGRGGRVSAGVVVVVVVGLGWGGDDVMLLRVTAVAQAFRDKVGGVGGQEGMVVLPSIAARRHHQPHLHLACAAALASQPPATMAPAISHCWMRCCAAPLQAVPLASVMTPNQFEAELLTGRSIAGVQGALQAAQQLLEAGPHTVVSGSVSLQAHLLPRRRVLAQQMLLCCCSVVQHLGLPLLLQRCAGAAL
jgi:hypothetical protein